MSVEAEKKKAKEEEAQEMIAKATEMMARATEIMKVAEAEKGGTSRREMTRSLKETLSLERRKQRSKRLRPMQGTCATTGTSGVHILLPPGMCCQCRCQLSQIFLGLAGIKNKTRFH